MKNTSKEAWSKRLSNVDQSIKYKIVEAARLLVEGDELGYEAELSREMKRRPYLKDYRAIAAGRILPELVHMFAPLPMIYDRVKTMPVESQKTLLKSGKLPTVEMHDGKVRAIDKPLHVASSADYLRACNKDGIRPYEEQKKTLLAAMPKPRAEKRRESRSAAIKADKATGEIVWNDLRAKPQDFMLAMKKLGWTLSK